MPLVYIESTDSGGSAELGQDLERLNHEGDDRGNYAVNLQTGRAASDQVAQAPYSVAIGYATKAAYGYGIAVGYKADAQNKRSIAIGYGCISYGKDCIAMGYANKPKGYGCVFIGGFYYSNYWYYSTAEHKDDVTSHYGLFASGLSNYIYGYDGSGSSCCGTIGKFNTIKGGNKNIVLGEGNTIVGGSCNIAVGGSVTVGKALKYAYGGGERGYAIQNHVWCRGNGYGLLDHTAFDIRLPVTTLTQDDSESLMDSLRIPMTQDGNYPADGAVAVASSKGRIVAMIPSTGDVAAWEFAAALNRYNGTMYMISSNINKLGYTSKSGSPNNWSISLGSDGIKGSLSVYVTGDANYDVYWGGYISAGVISSFGSGSAY